MAEVVHNDVLEVLVLLHTVAKDMLINPTES